MVCEAGGFLEDTLRPGHARQVVVCRFVLCVTRPLGCRATRAALAAPLPTQGVSIAGALKSYLRELPEPLMTFGLYEEWTQVAR